MKLSVVIPAYNEEKYLPKLLEDLSKQTFKDFEIIVADAHSKDHTRQEAEKYNAIVVDGGLPAKGRNQGAKHAQGDFLLFLDADIRIEKDFLQKALKEIEERFLDMATCETIPESEFIIDAVLHNFVNIFLKLNQYSDPHAPGFCIFISRRLFERIGGFDESLKLAEDHDLVKRAANYRPLRVLKNAKVIVSIRRLDKEGRLALSRKYIQTELYRAFYGELRSDVIEYEFGKFDEKSDTFAEKRLLDLDRKISSLNNKITKYFKDNASDTEVKKYSKSVKEKLAEIFKTPVNKK